MMEGRPSEGQRILSYAGSLLVTVLVGMTLGGTVMVYASAEVAGEPFVNVAVRAVEVSCSSSESAVPSCAMAVDGTLLARGHEWASDREGVGAWIRIEFGAGYTLVFVRIMQRYNIVECSSEVKMSFQGDRHIMMALDQVGGTSYFDYNGQLWNEMELDDVISSWVRIEITAVYSTSKNGFYELELYTGTNPCPPRYTFVSGTCYRYELTEQLTWEAAQHACAADHANLVGMETPEEKNAITAWMSRCFDQSQSFFWTSGKLSASDTWRWGDMQADWFDWEQNQPDVGNAVAWSVGSQKLLSARNTEQNRYLCEYTFPEFCCCVGAPLCTEQDWSPLQDDV